MKKIRILLRSIFFVHPLNVFSFLSFTAVFIIITFFFSLDLVYLNIKKIGYDHSLQMQLILQPETRSEDIQKIIDYLKSQKQIKNIKFFSSNQAKLIISKKLGCEKELLDLLPALSPVILIYYKLDKTELTNIEKLKNFLQARYSVREIKYDPTVIDQYLSLDRLVNKLVMPLFYSLSFLLSILIVITIKFEQLFYYKKNKILSYVGASNFFLKFPLVFKAIFTCLISEAVALILIKKLVIYYVHQLYFPPVWIEISYFRLDQLIWPSCCVLIIAIVSSLISVRSSYSF